MEMPALLERELETYSSATDDEELFRNLAEKPADFYDFFVCSVDDETWTDRHLRFSRLAVEWITIRGSEGKINPQHSERLLKKIQEHIRSLFPLLPLDIKFEIQGAILPVNSFLYEASSEIFKQYITNEIRGLKSYTVPFEHLSLEVFRVFQTYVQNGEVPDLWRKNETELEAIHEKAVEWGLTGLKEDCERVLKRYIMRGNVIEKLISAHREGYLILRDAAIDFFNDMDQDCLFRHSDPESLHFEFLEFRESALDYFQQVKHDITHLTFRRELPEDYLFSQVVNECPLLRGISLSDTKYFSKFMQDVPPQIQDLDVSSCVWLNADSMGRLATLFPNISRLALRNDLQLGAQAWAGLQKFKKLSEVDISYNPQINDEDFRLILQAIPQIKELRCSDSLKVGDKGFFEISRLLNNVVVLELDRCAISDGILVEIASRCRFLKELSVADAPLLTDKGVVTAVRLAESLAKLDISRCYFRAETVKELQRLKPPLKIIL